jgi:hypothetical protein
MLRSGMPDQTVHRSICNPQPHQPSTLDLKASHGIQGCKGCIKPPNSATAQQQSTCNRLDCQHAESLLICRNCISTWGCNQHNAVCNAHLQLICSMLLQLFTHCVLQLALCKHIKLLHNSPIHAVKLHTSIDSRLHSRQTAASSEACMQCTHNPAEVGSLLAAE